jgi:hypothetical protein
MILATRSLYSLEGMRSTLKIDVQTGDACTAGGA